MSLNSVCVCVKYDLRIVFLEYLIVFEITALYMSWICGITQSQQKIKICIYGLCLTLYLNILPYWHPVLTFCVVSPFPVFQVCSVLIWVWLFVFVCS